MGGTVPFVWRLDESGRAVPVERIAARNFEGTVIGEADSRVLLTIDAASHNAGQEEHPADRQCTLGIGVKCWNWEYNLMAAGTAHVDERGFWNTAATNNRIGSEATPQMPVA